MNEEALKLLKKAHDVFEDLFVHCLSNGVYNQWGKSFNCTDLNRVKYEIECYLKAEGKGGGQ